MSLFVSTLLTQTTLGTGDGDQWALGGDTWVVGCKLPPCTVFPEFNALNPDETNPLYNTENGIYQPGCGMQNLKYAFGHDEYLYRMVVSSDIVVSFAVYDGLSC